MTDFFKKGMPASGRLYRVSDEAVSESGSVWIISSEFPPGPGGIGKHAYDLARALAWRDYQVTIFTSQDYSTEAEIQNFNQALPSNIQLVRFLRGGWFIHLKRWNLVKRFLKDKKPERIIVTGRFPLWLGWLIKKRYGKHIPIHAFTHGSELGGNRNLNYLFTSVSLASPDHLWAVSNFTRNLIQNRTKRNDSRVLPNGLWLNDWPFERQHTSQVALEGSPVLITVGRISSRKGQHQLVRALPEITSIFPGVQYHLVGIPQGKETLQQLAQQLNVAGRVSVHGKVNGLHELAAYYHASDVFVMLSETQKDGNTEGFGIAILEANYFGKPAIGARGCGIEDAIMDGFNGRLVDGSNIHEVAEALKDIMDNYSAYSARAKKWAVRHDWKILIDQFISVEDVPVLTNINYEV